MCCGVGTLEGETGEGEEQGVWARLLGASFDLWRQSFPLQALRFVLDFIQRRVL